MPSQPAGGPSSSSGGGGGGSKAATSSAGSQPPTPTAPPVPSNEEVVTKLLHSLNVGEGQYEPQVVALLAEYMRTTMRTQLEEALDIAKFSNKKHIDLSDLLAASQLKDIEMEKGIVPSRDRMMEAAAEINSLPLKPIPKEFQVVLPKPHEMLSSRNYQVITAKEAFLGQSASQEISVGQLHATFRQTKPPAKRSRKDMKLVLNSPGGSAVPTPQATPTPPSTMPPPQQVNLGAGAGRGMPR